MKESDILIRQRQKYYNLLDDVSSTCHQLDKGISKLDGILNKVAMGYCVDEESIAQSHLTDTANMAREIHNQLAYSVIPKIEKKIRDLTNQISDAQMKELLERKSAKND